MEPEWISLNQFMRRNKLGYNTVIQMMNSGKLEYQKIGKQYKIKVAKDEKVNEEMRRLIEENAELKSYIKSIQSVMSQIKI